MYEYKNFIVSFPYVNPSSLNNLKEEKKKTMNLKGKDLLIIALAAIIILAVLGYFQLGPTTTQQIYTAPDGETFTSYADYAAYYQLHWGTTPPEAPPTTPTGRDPATLQVTFQNSITQASISGATTTLDVTAVVNGVVDFLTKSEALSVASAPDQAALFYSEGETLIFHCDSDTDATGGADHYDAWYYATLTEGTNVCYFTPACVSVRSSSPTYTYNFLGGGVATGHKVKYTAGLTPYWDLGVMYLTPRVNKTNLDIFITAGGTTLSNAVDGATWDDGDADIVANHTMTSTSENIYFQLLSNVKDLAFGCPMYTLTQNGELQERRAVMFFTTGMTAIGAGDLADEGWYLMSKGDLYAESGYYKVLDPIVPNRGDTFDVSIKIPIDASAAASSTAFRFGFWVHDFQMSSYVASGSPSTSIPTAYGFISEFGIDTVIHGTATLTVGSGAGATQHMMTYVTTP